MSLEKDLQGLAFTKTLLAQVNAELAKVGPADEARDYHGRWSGAGGSGGAKGGGSALAAYRAANPHLTAEQAAADEKSGKVDAWAKSKGK